MFETAVISYGPVGKRVWTTCLGMTGQSALVALAILIPLLSPAVLPKPQALMTWLEAPAPPPPPPPAPTRVQLAEVRVVRTQFRDGLLYEPVRYPARPQIFEDAPIEATGPGVPGGIPGGVRDGVPGGVLDSLMRSVAQPAIVPPPQERIARPAPAPAPAPVRVRISSIELAVPIRRIDPIYPPLARTARISGVVSLEGVIGTDGRIKELKVLAGHPLLVRAAVDAVSQWLYRPTILNGQPVEVVAPITVNFKLN